MDGKAVSSVTCEGTRVATGLFPPRGKRVSNRCGNGSPPSGGGFVGMSAHLAHGAPLLLSLVVSGCLMALSVGSPHYAWAGWFSLVALLLSIRILPPIQAMACGALWGMSFYAFSVSAVSTSIAPGAFSLFLLAAVPALYAYAGAWVTRRVGFSVLFLAYCWIGVELAVRPLALQSGLLVGAHGDGSFLHVVESLFGYVWVAFLVVYINGLLVSILSHAWSKSGRSGAPVSSGSIGELLLAPESLIYIAFALHACRPRGPPPQLSSS